MKCRLQSVSAGLIAAGVWAGLALDFALAVRKDGSIGAGLWEELDYFTILANVAVALSFSGLALGLRGPSRPSFLGGLVICMLLVGTVYWTLLAPPGLAGAALVATSLLHGFSPLCVALWWLAFCPKGKLRLADPARWAVFPLVYAAYALTRGALTGVYPYFFLDAGRIGWLGVLVDSAGIAMGYFLAGGLFVGVDSLASRAHRRG